MKAASKVSNLLSADAGRCCTGAVVRFGLGRQRRLDAQHATPEGQKADASGGWSAAAAASQHAAGQQRPRIPAIVRSNRLGKGGGTGGGTGSGRHVSSCPVSGRRPRRVGSKAQPALERQEWPQKGRQAQGQVQQAAEARAAEQLHERQDLSHNEKSVNNYRSALPQVKHSKRLKLKAKAIRHVVLGSASLGMLTSEQAAAWNAAERAAAESKSAAGAAHQQPQRSGQAAALKPSLNSKAAKPCKPHDSGSSKPPRSPKSPAFVAKHGASSSKPSPLLRSPLGEPAWSGSPGKSGGRAKAKLSLGGSGGKVCTCHCCPSRLPFRICMLLLCCRFNSHMAINEHFLSVLACQVSKPVKPTFASAAKRKSAEQAAAEFEAWG